MNYNANMLTDANIEYDEAKNKSNIEKHGVSFPSAKLMVLARYKLDTRKDYKETRFIITGYIMGKLFVMIATQRSDKLRIISLRKANSREVKTYETEYPQ